LCAGSLLRVQRKTPPHECGNAGNVFFIDDFESAKCVLKVDRREIARRLKKCAYRTTSAGVTADEVRMFACLIEIFVSIFTVTKEFRRKRTHALCYTLQMELVRITFRALPEEQGFGEKLEQL
jgi:hypothetical protein